MSKNITISDEVYLRLKEQAAQHGEAIETYLDRLTASTESDENKMLRDRLIAKGLLVTWPNPPPEIVDHPPVVVEGGPLSRTIASSSCLVPKP